MEGEEIGGGRGRDEEGRREKGNKEGERLEKEKERTQTIYHTVERAN